MIEELLLWFGTAVFSILLVLLPDSRSEVRHKAQPIFMPRQIRLALYSSNHLMKALNMRNKP